MNNNNKTQRYIKSIRTISIAFLILFSAFLLVCIYSYVTAENLREKYKTSISDSFERLELINQLFGNDTGNKALLRVYENIQNDHSKDSLRNLLEVNHSSFNGLVKQLDVLLTTSKQKEILKDIVVNRHIHKKRVDSLLYLLDVNQLDQATVFVGSHILPSYANHQTKLINLNNVVSESSQTDTNGFFRSLSSIVNNYSLYVLLAFVASTIVAFMLSKVFIQLHKENKALITEVQEREVLQKALSENQEQYKALFNNNPLPLILFDQVTLKILAVNEAATSEYGYSSEEFNNLTILDIKPKEEAAKAMKAFSPYNFEEATPDVFTKHKRKDGSVFEVELKTHSLPNLQGTKTKLVVALNVQEKIQATQKLEQSEQQISKISSSIPGAVYQFLVDKNGEISFPYISDGIMDIYGVTGSVLRQEPTKVFELMHPEDMQEVQHSINNAVQNVSPWYHEFRFWNSAVNSWKWVRGHSLPTITENGAILFNGTLIDITTQKEAQEEVLRNEANLQALLNSSPQAIFLLDEQLNIISFNKVATEETQRYLLRDLVKGLNILELVNVEMQQEVIKDHAIAMQGKEVLFETGNVKNWFEVSYRPAISKDGKVLAVALNIHDITDQKRTIETIRKSEAILNKTQQLAKIGSWEYNLESGDISSSRAFFDVYDLEDIKFNSTLDSVKALIHPDDLEKSQAIINKAIEERTDFAFEHKIIVKDNTIRHLHTIGEIVCNVDNIPVRITGATQDITELKLKEQEATQAKEMFRTTIENIPEVIFTCDTEFNIHYVSPQVRELIGYDESDFIGNADLWTKAVHPDDLDYLQNQIIPAILSGNKVQYELRLLTKTGEIRWVLIRQSPAFDKAGNVVRVDSSVSDIMDRKTEEARRTVLTEQLQNQNEHLQQFAYIVSHNLRTPLANILGLTSIFKRTEEASPFNTKVVDNLAVSAKLLDTTIRDLNDILTIRSQITNTTEEIYFAEIFESIMTSISQDIAQNNVSIQYDFTDSPMIHSIRSYIYSIIQNLIVNSIKFRSPDRDPLITVTSNNNSDFICLQITDNGLGLDIENQRDKIFGLYKRFHKNVDGKGLGLYLVKTQTELLGGRVEIESEINIGTTFKIFLKK